MNITSLIRTIPDYPKPGIQFRDITTLLKDPAGFKATIDALVERYRGRNITKVAGTEARPTSLLAASVPVAVQLRVRYQQTSPSSVFTARVTALCSRSTTQYLPSCMSTTSPSSR